MATETTIPGRASPSPLAWRTNSLTASAPARARFGTYIPGELGTACGARGLRERGKSVRSTIDCIIAAIAEDGGCDVLARDRDMDAILDSGLLKARRWPPRGPG